MVSIPSCKCSGSTCGCSVTSGAGVKVDGTGTAADPFVLSLDSASLSIGNAIEVATSSTLELTQSGSGATGDPVIISGDVVLRSPNGSRWTLAVSNAGVVSAVAAGAAGNGGTIPVGSAGGASNGLLFYNGSAWAARNTTGNVIWVSLGFSGVTTPPGFINGDVWLAENS